MKSRKGLAWFILIVVFAILACSQAGEVISPEEATARAEAVFTPTPIISTRDESTFAIGDEVVLTSNGPVVPMKETVTAANAIYFAPTGQIGTVVEQDEADDGVVWYRIESTAGTGWVREDQIEPPEDAGGEAADGGEGGSPGVNALYDIGDEVYVIGRGFMINLVESPGALTMVSQEQKGAIVTITSVSEFEGEIWYLVDGISIPGWVAEENLSPEAP